LRENFSIYLRLGVSIVITILILFSIINQRNFPDVSTQKLNPQFTSQKNSILLPPVDISQIQAAEVRQAEANQRKLEEELKRKERETKIQRTLSFLKTQHSPVANYEIASIIVDKSAIYGADFRVVVAIMGVESGFCNASFHYNCFGYLNGAEYGSYLEAFNDLVPKVSRQYAAKFGWNFEALAKAYGQVNWEYSSGNMRRWAGSI